MRIDIMQRFFVAIARLLCVIACVHCSSTWLIAQGFGTVSGTIFDAHGGVIIGATVTAQYVCPDVCVFKRALDQADSDEQGHYEFKRLAYGRYTVSAEKAADDYPPLWLPLYSHNKQPEVELSEANRSVTLDITLTKKAGVLVGTVADDITGDPLDASVAFQSSTDPTRYLSGSGLTKAQFRVLIPADTPLLMRVTKHGYEDWVFKRNGVIVPIQLGPSETLQLDIKLKKSEVR
jgi:Carboxypeptidase regulatory-like domain